MKKRKRLWLQQYNEVINCTEEKQFTSGVFIGKFLKLYEPEWKHLLERYEMEGLKKSKNIHASTSRVHWWEKIAATLFMLFVMTSAVWAEEFNQRATFLEHIKGWEWVYLEEGHEKKIKTPYYSVTYKEYNSHPEYRIVGYGTCMTVYDTNGNLVRQLTEVDGDFKFNKAKEEQLNKTNEILYRLAKGEIITQSLDKLSNFNYYERYDNYYDEFREYYLIPGVRSLGYFYNGLLCRRKLGYFNKNKIKKGDACIIDELNTQIQSQHMQIICENKNNVIYCFCHFDSIYVDSLYNKNLQDHFGDGFEKGTPLSFDTPYNKWGLFNHIVKDTLCHRQMVADYLKNMYDVKTKENAETLMMIEKELGIQKEVKEPAQDSLTFSELQKDAGKILCQTLGLPIDEKYYKMSEAELKEETQKYHPNWLSLEIDNRVKAATQSMAKYIFANMLTSAVGSSTDESTSNKRAAYKYLNFLKDEYKLTVTDIQRVDATTFEATIEIVPRGTIHKIIIHHQQTKPYNCERVIQFVS